jgi:predicted GNAT family acetyltransferase
VYTPPELRGRGYASALVARVTQHLLDGGRDYCFLYTDLANPTSNKIYVNVGYEYVCDSVDYAFECPVR